MTECAMATGRPVGGDPDQEQEEEVNLVVGLRFRPSDEELIGIYLFNEAIGGPSVTPCIKIPLLDVYGMEPWQLHPHVDTSLSVAGEFYCFTRLKRSSADGRRLQRRTPKGYWRMNGSWEVLNGNDRRRPCIGHRILLKFFLVDADVDEGTGSKRDRPLPWVMHEYRLRRRFWEMTSPNADELVICRLNPKGSEAPCPPDDGAERPSRPKGARTSAGCSVNGDVNNGASSVAIGGYAHSVASCDSRALPPYELVETYGDGHGKHTESILSRQKINFPAAAASSTLQELPISSKITQGDSKGGTSQNSAEAATPAAHCHPVVSSTDDSSTSSCELMTSETAAMDELVSRPYCGASRS